MKGKQLHKKLVLSKNWLTVWDLQVLPTRACVAVVPVATAQNGESFFVECSTLKNAPSLVWDFFPIDLWFTWRFTITYISFKSKQATNQKTTPTLKSGKADAHLGTLTHRWHHQAKHCERFGSGLLWRASQPGGRAGTVRLWRVCVSPLPWWLR